MGVRISGIALPSRTPVSFVVDGERLRASGESTSDDLWLLPGLVDVHSHPGMEAPGDAYDHELFRRHMLAHRAAGVLTVRSPGSPDPLLDRADDPDLPRLARGGRWLATPGRFFEGYGRRVTEDELPLAAAEDSVAGWCKVIGDWMPDDPPVPLDVLTATVEAVHAVGGRVAVHCQTAEGCRNAVLAGADSLEHGMHLDHSLLPRMAAQGMAFVPTLTAIGKTRENLDKSKDPRFKEWILSGWEHAFPTVHAAHEAGVTVLAGSDSKPCGEIAGEIAWLIKAGMPVEAAIGAGSWTARSWLGLPGLVDGGFADVVAYEADPVEDPSVLLRPKRIVLRGNVIA
ncbi:imidazolonepropionase-like amidohydrolase [Lentzea atacamensis]|uniref:Imidazolonepropionase-like amidohydrolase n=1 Tax=Lentzea atacamensis TaxID=531938 RepID=A0A316HRM1_9PSEU|nr:amidohydrolase family protein [Lentzea atacamensis]PWK83307.1 imidazolonepropionase-like amidohydrolase [Lentzea atacamensis]